MLLDLGKVDLNQLTLFHVTAECGSFTQAAKQLKMQKSRISRGIAALENDLGLTLIHRTTRQFRLTTAGLELQRTTLPLLASLKQSLQALNEKQAELKGQITMTIPEDLGIDVIGEVCAEFNALYPEVIFHIDVSNERHDLVKEGYDLAIRSGEQRDSTLKQRRLAQIDFVGIISPKLNVPTSLQQLHSMTYLGFTGASGRKLPLHFHDGKKVTSLELQPRFSCNNFFTLKSMALQGRGFTFVPGFVAKDALQRGDLVRFLTDYAINTSPMNMVFPAQQTAPKRVTEWMNFLMTRLPGKIRI